MNDYVEKMLEKSTKIIDGKVKYDGEIIQNLNKMGVKFNFTNDGVSWSF